MVARQRGVGLGLAVAGVLGQLVVTAVAVAQPFDGEQDAQPQSATLAIVGGLLIDGHEGPPLPRPPHTPGSITRTAVRWSAHPLALAHSDRRH